MAFHRIALLLAFAFIAVASVNSTKCYKCNSLSWEGCSEPQDPKYHTFECSTPKEDPACVQITFVRSKYFYLH
ncbi:unnamed protein product [Acanthoscelides obtectus]|uniref:Protein quiver n=1 Tax=Acanthoscelides obtectus TaxID=200917 RepID=A0A9P0NU69_ACAOB|nr:unnamed protein product [Acanthoscelides obtectus]CAK1679449.1 hypothetical protein AOBTE_LOCUS32253 [Acanthoscelides obtectus]